MGTLATGMNGAEAQRLLYKITNRDLVRVGADEGHAYYSARDYCLQWIIEENLEGGSDLVLKFEDAHKGAQIFIPHAKNTCLPSTGRDARSRIYDICCDLDDGISERMSSRQIRREHAVDILADLWATSDKDFAISFNPKTKFSDFWIQDFRKMPMRGITFSQAATKILGTTRRTKSRLRGDGRSFTLEGIKRQKIVSPILDPIARLRAISEFRTKALEAKIPEAQIHAVLSEASL